MRSFNIGFIGCGFVAQQCHLPAFSSIEGLNVFAIADPHHDVTSIISRQYGISHTYSSHIDLLSNEEIDCVVITLPRRLSYNIVKASLLAEKHVFTEKPLCLSSLHGDQLINVCKTKERILLPGYMRRYDAAVIELKKRLNLLDSHDIVSVSAYCHMGNSYCSPFGDIKGVAVQDIEYFYEPLPEWLPKTLYVNYEQFINVFSHITDLLEFIFGHKLDLKDCSTNKWGEGILLCTLGSIPVSLSLMRGTQSEWREGIDILTRKTRLQLNLQPAFLRSQPGFLVENYGDKTLNQDFFQPQWSWSFHSQAQALYSLLLVGKSNTETAVSAVNQIRFAESLFENYIC